MLAKIAVSTLAIATIAASVCAAPVLSERDTSSNFANISHARIGIPVLSTASGSSSSSSSSSESSLVASAADLKTASSTTSAATCSPSGARGVDNGIMSPAEGATVTAGQNFTLSYCSNAYHESSSVYYSVMATVAGDQGSGIYLATKVKTPEVTISIPDASYNVIVVMEKQKVSGQDNYQYSMFSHNITVVDA